MRITLKYISCERTGSELTEEPYILMNDSGGAERVWGPHHMRDGETLGLNEVFDLGPSEYVDIHLRESDTPHLGRGRADDAIGSLHITGSHRRGSFAEPLPLTPDLVGHRVRTYRIFYDVTNDAHDQLDRYCLKLDSLICNWTSAEIEEEICINVNGQRAWGPDNFKKGRVHFLNDQSITVTGPVWIQLWELDPVGRNDNYGTFVFDVYDDFPFGAELQYPFMYYAGGPGSSANSYSYVLFYRVFNREHLYGRRCGDGL
ncbi:hypothetical protein J2741_002602 [Methanolinea mesophila]|uniref:hypothetical protein n=1 Tax=Methanolinea mesophila TaxID=547055 RepID=UPI001AE89CC7|nr:hypothetical protein [Methanolinea mesophila]MBP1930006.1 hypothetical protein [Methanolinea mesophila]